MPSLYTSSRHHEIYLTVVPGACPSGRLVNARLLFVDRSRIFCAASSLYFKPGDEASVQRQVAVFSCWSGNLQFSSSECTSAVVIVRQRDRDQNKKHCSVSLDATSLLKMYATACENHNSTAVNLTHIYKYVLFNCFS